MAVLALLEDVALRREFTAQSRTDFGVSGCRYISAIDCTQYQTKFSSLSSFNFFFFLSVCVSVARTTDGNELNGFWSGNMPSVP